MIQIFKILISGNKLRNKLIILDIKRLYCFSEGVLLLFYRGNTSKEATLINCACLDKQRGNIYFP